MPGNLVSRLIDKMGNTHVKKMRNKRRQNERADPASQQHSRAGSPKLPGNQKFDTLKTLIADKPDTFLLNNIVMSIQLFSNYEMEIEEARKKLKANEDALNEKLLPEKSVIIPDVLHEHFADRITFTSNCKSDSNDQTVEPVRPIKIYAVYENVLVSEIDDTRHYSDPNDHNVVYNFILKEADHKGYVRLEQRTKPSVKVTQERDNADLSSIAEREDEIRSDDDSVYGPITKRDLFKRSLSNLMPDLVDEDEYYDEKSSTSSHGRARSNLRLQDILSKRLPPTPRPRGSLGTTSASSSSSGSTTTTTYNLDSDSDSSNLSSVRSHNNNNNNSLRRGSSSGKYQHEPVADIPPKCMKRITYMPDGRIYNPRQYPKPMNSQQKRIRDAKLARNYDVVYVNGYKMAKHFYERFKQQLGQMMEFDDSTVKSAKRCDATIRLEKIAYMSTRIHSSLIQIEPYEVIPCFLSPWPKWARSFRDRQRTEWPHPEDVLQAEKFGCCLVPEPARAVSSSDESASMSHPLWKLDWSLSFPAAERYLEICLSPTQISVLTVALVLHKTFIRELGSNLGLNTSHIRNMVFWMVERDSEWSELQMGQWLLRLLEALYNQIQQRVMRDYFMPERNLFASVNKDDLLHAQKQLKRIIENPVMFVMHAIEKIQYERDNFPRLDYAELLKLLTLNVFYLRNPGLDPQRSRAPSPSEANEEPTYDYARREEKDFWNDLRKSSEQYQLMRNRNVRPVLNPVRALDSVIDIQESCEPLKPERLAMLAKFFADHFLKMAHRCHELGAMRAKRAYLEQTKLLADLLCELLSDDQEHLDAVSRLIQRARQLRESAPPTPTSPPEAPVTPRRNDETTVRLERDVETRLSLRTQVDDVESESAIDCNELETEAESTSETEVEADLENTRQIEVEARVEHTSSSARGTDEKHYDL